MAKKASTADSVPVAPNSVRVWTGFRLPSLKQETFFEKLGSIFCPGTVLIQKPVGLTAYLPSVLPGKKPEGVPDEIAVVFYREGKTEADNTYHLAKKTVGGRAYSDLHALVFDLKQSTSGFPDRFDGNIKPNGRYFLFDKSVDWQHGVVNVFVGARKASDSEDSFPGKISKWLKGVQDGGGPDAAIAATAPNYVVYWEHWPNAKAAKASSMEGLSKLSKTVYHEAIDAYPLPQNLWDFYAGVEVKGGESFNFQFERIDLKS